MLIELIHTPEFNRFSRAVLGLLKTYFRVKVEGIENLPKHGRAIITPNHSGYAGTDAVLMTDLIKRKTRRRSRILAHRAFFDYSKEVKTVAESFGLRRAGVDEGVTILQQDHLLILFPEGETGNFKPTFERYHLQKFHTGFLRMAILAKAPIIPCVVIGAEESHLNLGNFNLSSLIRGLRIPIPISLVPLPAKWKIKFLTPIDLSDLDPSLAENKPQLEKIAANIQARMQEEIIKELRNRPYIYFKETRALYNFVRHRKKPVAKPARPRRAPVRAAQAASTKAIRKSE